MGFIKSGAKFLGKGAYNTVKYTTLPARYVTKNTIKGLGRAAGFTIEQTVDKIGVPLAKAGMKTAAGFTELATEDAIRLTKGGYNLGKNFLNKITKEVDPDVSWIERRLKTPAIAGVFIGVPALNAAYTIAKDEKINANEMALGTISAEEGFMPNQVTYGTNPYLRDAKPRRTMELDTLGADGELAMALHYLNNRRG